MKVSVEIPKGKYCKDCRFNGVNTDEGEFCYYLQEDLEEFSWEGGSNVKHPDCPGKEEG